jgi:hypothetical protein
LLAITQNQVASGTRCQASEPRSLCTDVLFCIAVGVEQQVVKKSESKSKKSDNNGVKKKKTR